MRKGEIGIGYKRSVQAKVMTVRVISENGTNELILFFKFSYPVLYKQQAC